MSSSLVLNPGKCSIVSFLGGARFNQPFVPTAPLQSFSPASPTTSHHLTQRPFPFLLPQPLGQIRRMVIPSGSFELGCQTAMFLFSFCFISGALLFPCWVESVHSMLATWSGSLDFRYLRQTHTPLSFNVTHQL